MKIAFVVGDIAGISGGANVIIEHARQLTLRGCEVWIVGEQTPSAKWHDGAKALHFAKFSESEQVAFDFVFATWWQTAFQLWRLQSRVYGYFNQSYESRFHEEPELKRANRCTYALPLLFVTEARWLGEFIQTLQPTAPVVVVPNGLSRDFFPVRESVPAAGAKLRVLVEGPYAQRFNGVQDSFAILEGLDVDIGWLTSNSDGVRPKVSGRAVTVHEAIPIAEVRHVLEKYDVMLKLSTVEGVFGPPLEMFSQGGTAITYPVTGYDEYIRHNENALVAPPFKRDQIAGFVQQLARDPALLERLRTNALATARAAIDWPESGARFHQALSELKGYSNAALRPALQLMAAMGWQWLDSGDGGLRLSASEQRLVERYRRVKSSAAAKTARAVRPSPLLRCVRQFLSEQKAPAALQAKGLSPPSFDPAPMTPLSHHSALAVSWAMPPVTIEGCEIITDATALGAACARHGVLYFGGDEAQMASDPTPMLALAHGVLLVARAPFPSDWGIEPEDDYLVRENSDDYAQLVRELNATPFLHQATRVRAWQKTRELFSAEATRNPS